MWFLPRFSSLNKLTPLVDKGWTTSDFLKSTFMWWKSSRSRLVADDIINEQISLELWQTPCVQLWNMTQRCPRDYCTYNSIFLSVLLSLGHYISHRFLLVLNQIQISSTVKIKFIWMNALVRAVACVCINSTCSVSLLVVKLWDLVIKKYMHELSRF